MNKVIEAASGFYVLDFFGGDEHCPQSVDKIPVLGWFIENASGDSEYITVKPITLGGVGSKEQSILSPNGEVSDRWGMTWTYDKWLEIERIGHEADLINAREAQQ
jgi:hypothetical protein